MSELLELPLPFNVDLYEATVDDITFGFPEDHPAAQLGPVSPLNTPSVLYGDVTFTYSMGRQIKDYVQEAASCSLIDHSLTGWVRTE